MSHIAFTYHRQCRKNYKPTINDYDIVLTQLRILGNIDKYVFELDSKDKIHLHGVLSPRRDYPVCRYKVKKFNCHIDNIFDLSGWMDYLMKNQKYNSFANDDNGFPLPYNIFQCGRADK